MGLEGLETISRHAQGLVSGSGRSRSRLGHLGKRLVSVSEAKVSGLGLGLEGLEPIPEWQRCHLWLCAVCYFVLLVRMDSNTEVL